MKLCALIMVVLLAFGLTSIQAQQGPDDQFVTIYGMIQQADELAKAGQPREALAGFQAAQSELKKFASIYPEWNPNILKFRQKYLEDKIAATTALLPAAVIAPPIVTPVAGTAADQAAQINDLRGQVQMLQADNATLTAKLKEALAVQPSATDPQALAVAQEKILALTKENDLLEVSLAAAKSPADKSSTGKKSSPAAGASVKSLTEQVKTLQARLAVDEASPVPYTAQELSLFQPDASASAGGAADKKSDQAIPAGAAGLLAAAQVHFAAQEYDQAIDLLGRAAALDAQNPEIENLLGTSLAHKGLRPQAEAALRKALLLDPDYGPAHQNLALVYISEQPPRAALARWHYQKALANGQPHNADLEKLLADNGAAVTTP